MDNFANKIAVVTGGGTGMGRELVRQLAKEGCHVAMCDVIEENMLETFEIVSKESPNITLSKHVCDVSDEEQVNNFKDEVLAQQNTQTINLLFNNAGIGGGGSFITSTREEWERCFAVCWYGVYYCSRAFMQSIVESEEGHIVNTSSVNGFWASLGGTPHTSYSAAKFAVKGFSEALIDDFRVNAPHVGVSVVMPGHIGTSIAENTGKILGGERSDEDYEKIKENMIKNLQPGSVIYDLAAVQGGNTAYTEADKVIEKNGVRIMGESNILNKLPISASNLYAKNIFNFVNNLLDKDNKKININLDDEIIKKTLMRL